MLSWHCQGDAPFPGGEMSLEVAERPRSSSSFSSEQMGRSWPGTGVQSTVTVQDKGPGIREEDPLLPFLPHPSGRWGRPGKGRDCSGGLGAMSAASWEGWDCPWLSFPPLHIPGARIAEEFRLQLSTDRPLPVTAGMRRFLGEVPDLCQGLITSDFPVRSRRGSEPGVPAPGMCRAGRRKAGKGRGEGFHLLNSHPAPFPVPGVLEMSRSEEGRAAQPEGNGDERVLHHRGPLTQRMRLCISALFQF